MTEPHELGVRVYYEDTDLAGIVYYANYFKYIERGRTEFLRSHGIDQMALKDVEGVVFAVRKVSAEFLAPARMDDELTVTTSLTSLTGARIVMSQMVLRDGLCLFTAEVVLAALKTNGKPARIPQKLRALVT